jgi:hypothetical protein
MRKEIDSIEGPVDSERAAEPARPTTKVASALGRATALHQAKTYEWFERSDEHAGSFSIALARQIEAVRRSIDLIDVGAVGRTEERRVARALPAVRVTRWVSRKIGFRFHDPARHDTLIAIAYDYAT